MASNGSYCKTEFAGSKRLLEGKAKHSGDLCDEFCQLQIKGITGHQSKASIEKYNNTPTFQQFKCIFCNIALKKAEVLQE